MKKLNSFLIVIILFTISCKEKEPTAPTDNTPTNVLAETTIGQEGGELKTDIFYLAVPSGAFSSDETLTLTEDNVIDPFGDNTVSKQYRVEGLPDNYSKSLKVVIKHDGGLSDESFILVGEEGMSAANGQPEMIYNFISAKDSSGYLTCNVSLNPVDPNSQKTHLTDNASVENKWILIKAVSKYFSSFGGSYEYSIYVPSADVSSISEIVSNFDAAYYSIMGEMDLDLPQKLPSIYIANLSGEDYCKFAYRNASGDKKAKGLFAINSNKFNDMEKMKWKINEEVFWFVLFGYDPTYPNMVEPQSQPHFWLKQALITLNGEENVSFDEVPEDFIGHELAPLNGMHAGIYVGDSDYITNAKNHGKGMSAFFQHLSPGAVGPVLVKIKEGVHPVEAFAKLFTDGDEKHLSTYWIEFLFKYVHSYDLDKIYDIPHETFINSISNENTFNINSQSDSLKEFKRSYNDLSGKLFRINVNDSEIRENEKIQFKIDHPNINEDIVRLFMFGVEKEGDNSERLNFIDQGSDIIVSNLKRYDPILALVANGNYSPPYTNTTELELEVRLNQGNIQFKHCDIKLSVVAIDDTLKGAWNPGWYTDGSFTNNIYTGTINKERQGGNAHGTIKVEVDDKFNIKTLEVEAYHTDEYGSSEWGFSAANVPPFENEPYLVVYNSSGHIVCSYVTSIYAKYTNLDESYTEYKHFECEEESLLHIKFHNYD